MRRALAFLLDGHIATRKIALGFQAHSIHVGPHHHNSPFGRQSGSGGQNMPQKAAPGGPVHNLGQGGFHPRSHARRQDNQCNISHFRNLPRPQNPFIFGLFKTLV